jgi:hypothetical protein
MTATILTNPVLLRISAGSGADTSAGRPHARLAARDFALDFA